MKKNFILKFVLVCLSLCISFNARTQTDAYQNYLESGVFSATQAPTGEVRFPAEFEPVQSVMVVYPLELPWKLLQEISEDCKLITVINRRKASSITIDEIKTEYNTNGVTISNCEFIIANNDNLEDGINSHWIRDFGPWYIFHGKDVAIVDNIYNRSFVDDKSNPISSPSWTNGRWRDDKFAADYAKNNSVPLYGMEVVHTGGNMMQDGRGVGVSDLIVHTQSETFAGLSKETVNQRMEDYLGIDTYHVTDDPQGDYIAHVDCWGKFLAPDKIIIARVPNGHERYSAYEEVASYFAGTNCCWGYPYKVYRVDIPVTKKSEIADDDKIAPYTNCLILNNKVLVPISSLTASSYNDAALDVYREAMPGYEIIGIDYIKSDAYGQYSGWENTDALHCRTRDIMDFDMLFVDHRNVLFGEQAYKESYPITAKFIAYSGNNITSTQLHYSINDGAYQTVEMTATGNADEYVANITGHNNGNVIKYYVTGEDEDGRTCVQPQFGELEPHTFTVGKASDEEPETPVDPEPTPDPLVITADKTTFTANGTDAVTFYVTQGGNAVNDATIYVDGVAQAEYTFSTTTAKEYTVYAQKGTLTSETITITAEAVIKPEIDLTKYYRIKVVSGTSANQYLHISNTANTVVTSAKTNDLAQIFKIEDDGNGNYCLKSANGLYIKCDAASGAWWSIYGNATNKTPLQFEYTNETEFYIRDYDKITGTSATTNSNSANSYFKVENGTVYCDAPKTLAEVVTWVLEETELPLFLTADKETITANGTDVVTFTVKQGNDAVNDATIYVNGNAQTEYTFSTATAGDYIVYAKWGNLTSESITITAEAEQPGGDGGDTSGNVVTIGDASTVNTNSSANYPFCNTYKYSHTQQIYSSAVIKSYCNNTIPEGDITKIKYYISEGTQTTFYNVKVYMRNSTVSTFAPTGLSSTEQKQTWDKDFTTNDLVFEGNVDVVNNAIEMTLIKPFAYDDTKNLIIYVDVDDVNSQNGTTATKFRYTNTFADGTTALTDKGLLYYRNNNNNAGLGNWTTASGSPTNYLSVVSLTFGDGGDEPATPVAPAVPANLTASATETTVVLSWDAVDGASYNVYQGEDLLANVTETTYTVENLTANTDYTFTVKAVKDELESDAATVTVTTLAPTPIAPAAPANLTATATETTVTLTWDAVDGASYNVYQGEDLLTNVTETTYTVENLTANTSYTFTVKAVKDELESDAATVTVTTLAPTPVAPAVPANLTASATETTVVLSWDAVDGASYNVYQGEDLLANVTETTYTVENLTANTSYTFTVKAVKDQLESDAATVTVTTEAEQGGGNTGGDDNTGGDVVIGDVTSTKTSDWVPIRTYERYSISQQYYLKEEIGKGKGTISSIAFHTADGDWGNGREREITIYMQNTTESYFVDNVMKEITAENTVFEGSVTFTSNTWINFDLNDKFTYEGENILVCVYDHTGLYTDKETFFKSFEITDSNKARSNCKAGKDVTSSPIDKIWQGGNKDQVAIIKFTFEEEKEEAEPIFIAADKDVIIADGEDAITFTVTQGEEGTGTTVDDADIYVNGEKIDGNSFTTTETGTYTVYAMKDDVMSNEITFTAEHSLVLSSLPTTITANGTDMATFTVMQGDVDVTEQCTFWYGTSELRTNTFSTTTPGYYTFYATKGGIESNKVTIMVTEYNAGGGGNDGNGETVYYPDGRVTYNLGTDREYTLLIGTDPTKDNYGTIKQDNVYTFGDGNNITYLPKDDNKPQTPTTLILPDRVLSGSEWIPVTKIEAYAFDDLFKDGEEPGNALNGNFTNLIIPSTIEEISTYTFGFSMGEGSSILCFAKTPPALSDDCTNNPFLSMTYNNSILYVLPESIEAYQNAEGWGTPFMSGLYFKNIYPITMPTFVGDENGEGEWNEGNNWRTYVKNEEDVYVEQRGVVPAEGEDILILGDATIPQDYAANVGTIYLIDGSITIAEGGQLIHTNGGVVATVQKGIAGYEGKTGNVWHTISSPITPSVKAANVVNLLANKYDLYRYDEPTHYWDNIEDLDDLEGPQGDWETLDAGRGYLYANQNDVTLEFTGVLNHDKVNFELDNSCSYEGLKGINLIGNPYAHNIYKGEGSAIDNEKLAEGYYSLSEEGQWGAIKGDEPIAPCQSILVKIVSEEEETLEIKKIHTAPTTTRATYPSITIGVANEYYSDEAHVMFKDGIGLNKVAHMNKDIPMISVINDDDIFAIATMDDDTEEINIRFEAMTMGQYTIGAKAESCEFENMYLVDRMTGVKTDLSLESYTFMATTHDNPNRFVITLGNNDDDTAGDFIYINGNEMIINGIDGEGSLYIYDVVGRPVEQHIVSGSARICTDRLAKGVYIVRMTDGNNVRTQKVVIG